MLNKFSLLLVLLATLFLGAICAPLDPEYTYAEKQHLLKKLKPKMCFGDIRTSAHLERILYTLNLNTEVFSFTQEGLGEFLLIFCKNVYVRER